MPHGFGAKPHQCLRRLMVFPRQLSTRCELVKMMLNSPSQTRFDVIFLYRYSASFV
jgi:hypothetical protein